MALAQRLVRIRSENPPGDTAAVCEALAALLGEAGFRIDRVEPQTGFVSIVATLDFARPGPTLALCGHVDVVPAEGPWSVDPWGGEIVEGRLYGRGSLDMKGPLAGLVTAALRVRDRPLRGRLVVAAVADEEEGGHRGAGALVGVGAFRADGVVIAEPGDGAVVVAHRGMCFLELETKGRPAHASMPAEGINAVESMVDVLTCCRSLGLRHDPHPLLGSPTVAIGTTIAGGEKANIVPARCRATLDVRKVPGMTDAGVVEDLTRHLERAGFRLPADVEVRVLRSGEPAETRPDDRLVEAALTAYEQEFGFRPDVRGTVAATDGWWFTGAGMPTIMALGPGGIGGCHVVDESVEVDELCRYTNVYESLVERFLADPHGASAPGAGL